MILIENLKQISAQLKNERAISLADLADAIQQSLVAAYARKYGEADNIGARLDITTGECRIIATKTIVETVDDEAVQISIESVKSQNLLGSVGDTVEVNVTPDTFGRVAVQAAKNVIMQLINEAEKNYVYDKFRGKIGQLVNGVVQRIEGNNYLINLGDVEAVLTKRDQIPGEVLTPNDHIRVFLSDISMGQRGPSIRISRSCPEMLQELFKLEIPEIQQKNVIEIKGVVRDAGLRSKVAVYSNHPDVGAVGTCVGHMGARIQNILKELSNERIDILEWDENPVQFISNSMKPATVSKVLVTNTTEKQAIVVVAKDQLSLAIGKRGVNVRLAVRLTGWKLDILSEEDYESDKDNIQVEETESLSHRIERDIRQEKPVRLADNIRQQLKDQDDYQPEVDDDDSQLSQLAHMYGLELPIFYQTLKDKGIIIDHKTPLTADELDRIRDIFGKVAIFGDKKSDEDALDDDETNANKAHDTGDMG